MLQTIGGSDLEPLAVVVGSIQEHIIVNNNLHQNNASILPNQLFYSAQSNVTKIMALLLTITSNPLCSIVRLFSIHVFLPKNRTKV